MIFVVPIVKRASSCGSLGKCTAKTRILWLRHLCTLASSPITALTAQPFRSPFRIPGVSDCTHRVCQYRPIIAPPTAFLFCTADLSLWHIRIYVAWKALLFGWLLSDRFMRVFRCPTNLKSGSIAPAVFLFCTADRSLWHLRVCVEWNVLLFGAVL